MENGTSGHYGAAEDGSKTNRKYWKIVLQFGIFVAGVFGSLIANLKSKINYCYIQDGESKTMDPKNNVYV